MSEQRNEHGTSGAPGAGRGGAGPGEMLDRAGEIFLAVRDLGMVTRDDAIDQKCAGDIELKKLVMLLLRGDQAPLPVESLADDIRAACDVDVAAEPGWSAGRTATPGCDRIGNYHILDRLGEGGFGVVYLAEQERPVRRRVALKIIKLGMDTRQVVARFEAERQALALMNHPNIAKVFDAGTTETGRPYFVMELVRGSPITEYANRKKLSIRQRLSLISQVCDALQHAHQKGVIHRDIKPSNVLVEGVEGARDRAGGKERHDAARGPELMRVKVIDFGIAKATSARLTEKTVFTEFRQMIGTPEYMSPEQAGESCEDVDTRTDVYSAGVLLYELLTGSTPFDSKRLRSAAFGEMQRIIREEDPPRPSTKLTASCELLDAVANDRGVRPDKLTGIVRGELDWIVMKALEKDRSRRYESAGDMSADIRRYLSGHAVLAAPPSRSYRARTFVRRHRGSVAAALLLAGALTVGLAGTSIGLVSASAERRRADDKAFEAHREARRADEERVRADKQRERAVAAEQEAKARADELEKVADFQQKMLSELDPTKAGLHLVADLSARFDAALDGEGSGGAAEERAARSEAFRGMLRRVNSTDVARALIDDTMLKPAAAAVDRQFAGQPRIDAMLREGIAERYRALGMYESSLRLCRQAAELRKRMQGDEHPDTLSALSNVSALLRAVGRLDESESQYRALLATMRRTLGEDHEFVLQAMDGLANTLSLQGKAPEAEELLRDGEARCRRALGESNPTTLTAINNLGIFLYGRGKWAEAEPFLREAVEKDRRVLGEDDPETLTAVCNLGLLLKNTNKLDEAEPYLRDALERRRVALGDEHPDTLIAMTNVGTLLLAQEKTEEAESTLREALTISRRVLGDNDQQSLALLNNLGAVLKGRGNLEEALTCYREAAEGARRLLTNDHPTTVTFVNNLGSILLEMKRYDEAEPFLREAVEKRLARLTDDHPQTWISKITLGLLLATRQQHAEAIELLAPIEDRARKAFTGNQAARVGSLLLGLGKARTGLGFAAGQFSLAETNLNDAHAILTKRGKSTSSSRECERSLTELYSAWDSAESGKGYDVKAREWKEKGQSDPG